jgi:hypothetical protein
MTESDERFERIEKNLDKLTLLVMEITTGVRKLERAAGVLLINDEELDRRLTELENKPRRKPQ